MSLMKLCARCHAVIPQGQTYCARCAPICAEQNDRSRAQRARQYSGERDARSARFYKSKSWRMLRDKKLSDAGYLCEVCREKGITKIAEDVHHKEPIKENWEKRLDYDNLQAVCVSCHNKLDKRF